MSDCTKMGTQPATLTGVGTGTAARRPYSPPHVVRYGTLAQVTQANNGPNQDQIVGSITEAA